MDITFAYPLLFKSEEGGWVITCRDLPELVSQAAKGEDRVEVAEGALQAAIEGRLLLKRELPIPSAARGDEVMVTLPVETATKAALHLMVAEEKVSKSDLARRIDLDEKEVRRLLDPQHSSKVPRIADALAAYGRRLQISVVRLPDHPSRPRAATAEIKERAKAVAKEIQRTSTKIEALSEPQYLDVAVRNRGVHVEPRQGEWVVRVEGNSRASSVHGTKAAAIDSARGLARSGKVDLVVHGRDGKVQESRRNYRPEHPRKGRARQ